MAKSVSVFNLQGTIAGLTFVKSLAYGDHVRAKRGTYKRTQVNNAFKNETKKLLSANVPAKIIHDAIRPYRDDLTGGNLWQRLVSVFRNQFAVHGKYDLAAIGPLEIHLKHPFERFLTVQHTARLNEKKSILEVDIRYDRPPKFTKSRSIDGYRLSLIGIFPDLKKQAARTIAAQSEIFPLTGPVPALRLQLRVPPKSKSFILCVKIDGCTNGEVASTRTTQGLRVIGGGVI